MGVLRLAEPPQTKALYERLGSRLRSYRAWRERDDGPSPTPEVGEVIPLWEVPAATTIEKEMILHDFDRWHVQVFLEGEPRYYARCAYQDGDRPWRVDWIGEAWLARAVERGISLLDGLEDSLDGEIDVRLVSSRRFRFSAFWLVNPDRFLVISSQNRDLQTAELLSMGALRSTLLRSEGPEGWIGRGRGRSGQ